MVEFSRRKAFAEYVLPEVETLYRVARTLTSEPAEAEKLVQDTLLQALRSIDQFDGHQPRVWLLRLLRETGQPRSGGDLPQPPSDPGRPGAETSSESAGPGGSSDLNVDGTFDALVEQAFTALPDKYRRVVDLIDVEGLSYAAAATVLGVSVGTVASRLHRARNRIRRDLAAEGILPKRGGE